MQSSFHARKREEKIDPNFTATYIVQYHASDYSGLGYFLNLQTVSMLSPFTKEKMEAQRSLKHVQNQAGRIKPRIQTKLAVRPRGSEFDSE